jgi:hypothetical protein
VVAAAEECGGTGEVGLKPSNQAVCTVRLADGGRKDIYLGLWNSAASKAEYNRIVSIVSANARVYLAACIVPINIEA